MLIKKKSFLSQCWFWRSETQAFIKSTVILINQNWELSLQFLIQILGGQMFLEITNFPKIMQSVYYIILPVGSRVTSCNQIIFWKNSILIFTLSGIKTINSLMSVHVKFCCQIYGKTSSLKRFGGLWNYE